MSFHVPIAKISSPPEYTTTIFLASSLSLFIMSQYLLKYSFFSFAAFFFSRIKFIFLLKKSDKYLDNTTDFDNVTYLYLLSVLFLSTKPDWNSVPKLSTSALKTASLSIPLAFSTNSVNSMSPWSLFLSSFSDLIL